MIMKKQHVTKGPVRIFPEDLEKVVGADGVGIAVMSGHNRGKDEREANAAMIAEAFDIFDETGLTPREIALMVGRLRKSIRHTAHCHAPEAFHCTCDANALWDDTKSFAKYAQA